MKRVKTHSSFDRPRRRADELVGLLVTPVTREQYDRAQAVSAVVPKAAAESPCEPVQQAERIKPVTLDELAVDREVRQVVADLRSCGFRDEAIVRILLQETPRKNPALVGGPQR